ncbi:MAG: SOS response-associated peptidase [Terracidiphilus sp.]
MCCRFMRQSELQTLSGWFDIEPRGIPFFAASYNIAPQSVQPVVRLNSMSGSREFTLQRWGLVPFWAKDAKPGFSTFNARAEEVLRKPAFREALKSRRCLVPADGFYEWQQVDAKTKQPFAIALASGEPFAFAGLWESWQPAQGPPLETFAILTTSPNEIMQPIHNRMPVILEPRDYDHWLVPGDPARPPIDLLRPFPAEKMLVWPVSGRVGNVRNNDPELLDRIQPSPQQIPAGMF